MSIKILAILRWVGMCTIQKSFSFFRFCLTAAVSVLHVFPFSTNFQIRVRMIDQVFFFRRERNNKSSMCLMWRGASEVLHESY